MRAGVQGLEPRYPGPKPGVLPLDDTPVLRTILRHTYVCRMIVSKNSKNAIGGKENDARGVRRVLTQTVRYFGYMSPERISCTDLDSAQLVP